MLGSARRIRALLLSSRLVLSNLQIFTRPCGPEPAPTKVDDCVRNSAVDVPSRAFFNATSSACETSLFVMISSLVA